MSDKQYFGAMIVGAGILLCQIFQLASITPQPRDCVDTVTGSASYSYRTPRPDPCLLAVQP